MHLLYVLPSLVIHTVNGIYINDIHVWIQHEMRELYIYIYPQEASFCQQMLQTETPIELKRFQGAGASFLQVSTTSWHFQVVQVPKC